MGGVFLSFIGEQPGRGRGSAAPPSPPCLPSEMEALEVASSWTLLDETTVLASPLCSSPFPHGNAVFREGPRGPTKPALT